MKMRSLVCWLVIGLLLLSSSTVMAASPSNRPPEPSIGRRSDNPNEVRVDIILLDRDIAMNGENSAAATGSGLLAQVGCSLRPTGTALATMDGYTYSIFNSDTISVQIYLQRWDGAAWVDVSNKFASANNTDYVVALKDCSVTGYVRVRAVHSAKTGSTTDTDMTISDFIYVQ